MPSEAARPAVPIAANDLRSQELGIFCIFFSLQQQI